MGSNYQPISFLGICVLSGINLPSWGYLRVILGFKPDNDLKNTYEQPKDESWLTGGSYNKKSAKNNPFLADLLY